MSLNTNTVGRGGGSTAVQTGLTASTTATQAGGLTVPLIAGVNNVTVSTGNTDSVALPKAVQGAVVIIKNSDAGTDIDIWPFTGDKVNAGTLNAKDTNAIGQTSGRMYVCVTTQTSSADGDWISFGMPIPAT